MLYYDNNLPSTHIQNRYHNNTANTPSTKKTVKIILAPYAIM